MNEFGTKHHPESHEHGAPIETVVFEESPERRTGQVQIQSGEIVVDGTGALNRHQRESAQDQLRLYHRLCGGIVGQYWPQALLESGGSLNRPQFPGRPAGQKR